ncbi:SHOCT domain-containing protein [Ornithinimicrobium sufpigmenti]|uniref:SHOCT domain-containing protein n=1 Tax=Ornithinimicrobium sufpigmenti TaxID=2508882 RepID=UPI001036689E|nr:MULTISPECIES: SHOCT domain-containing protein [unclassified Ornithinimicrobium]
MLTHSMGWGMWLLMAVSTVAFWGLVLLVVRALLDVPRGARPDSSAPFLLLQERLARGELTPEQYEQHRRLLVDGH